MAMRQAQLGLNLLKRKRQSKKAATPEEVAVAAAAAEKAAKKRQRQLADPAKARQHQQYLYRQRVNCASKDQNAEAAIVAFDEMVAAGFSPTAPMFNQVLALCSTFQRSEAAVRVFALMEKAAERSAAAYAAVAGDVGGGSSSASSAEPAKKKTTTTTKKKKKPIKVVISESTVTALVKLHSRTGAFERAEELMRSMQKRFGLKLKARTYTPLIVACCGAFREDDALRLVRESIVTTDKDPAEDVFRALVALLSARSTEPAAEGEVEALASGSGSGSGSASGSESTHADAAVAQRAPPLLSAWAGGSSEPTLHRATERLYRVLSEMVEVVLRISGATRDVLESWFASPSASAHLSQLIALEASTSASATSAAAAAAATAVAARWRWRVEASTVDESGMCARTGRRLRQIQLGTPEHARLCGQVETCLVAANSGRRDKEAWRTRRQEQFAAFKRWLGEEQQPAAGGPFACFIDGANVGYFNQNHAEGGFAYAQVDAVIRHYEERGLRPLLVLHAKYFKRPNAITNRWKAASPKILFICEPGNNDDWYWLGGALYAPLLGGAATAAVPPGAGGFSGAAGGDGAAPAVEGGGSELPPWTGGRDGALFFSNDQMRDHHWMMLDDMKGRYFQKWRASHQVHYTFKYSAGANRLTVIEPPTFSYRAQRTTPTTYLGALESARAAAIGWHFPAAETGEWLTVVPVRDVDEKRG